MATQFRTGELIELPELQFTRSVTAPASRSAIVVVDMQNDFVKPEGRLVCPTAAATVPAIAGMLARARKAGVRIAFTQDTHREGDLEWNIWPEHCREGTWGWQIVDELAPQPEDLVVPGSRYDAFYDTSLDHYLTRVWKVEHLLIVGTIANICVLHTIASAGLRWFHVVTALDGISALTDFDMALTIRQVGWLYTGNVLRSVEDFHFAL